jgi:hypothetical protein
MAAAAAAADIESEIALNLDRRASWDFGSSSNTCSILDGIAITFVESVLF